MTQKLFAGIDGGQTATTAIVGNDRGEIVGRGIAGPADEIGEDPTSTRLRDALEGALRNALTSAGIPADAHLESVVAGVSGYEGTVIGALPRFNAAHVRLLHDAPIAHAGAFDGKPGVLTIAGTGSVAYGVDERGEHVTVGGWGYLFGDEGSAFWIARTALKHASQAEAQKTARDEPLLRLAREAFDFSTFRQFVSTFHSGEISRDRIAAFARVIIEHAESGDDRCTKIARAAITELTQLTAACAKRLRLGHPDVAFVGGLLTNHWFVAELDKSIAQTPMRRIEPLHEPAMGALLMAHGNDHHHAYSR